MILRVFVLGPLENNCYLVFDKKTKNGFIVDAPSGFEKVQAFIEEKDLDISFLILTHGHFDHISGLELFDKQFYIHRDDAPLLRDANLNGSALFASALTIDKPPCILDGEEALHFEKYPLEIIHTPGHTPGSICIKCTSWLFSGDTIFYGSVGRTDAPCGSEVLLIESIKNKILTLKSETIIYPGHGPKTNVGRERKHNPFVA